jgi:hypothetical protein
MSNIGGTGGSSASRANNIGTYNLDEINHRLEEMMRRMEQRALERPPPTEREARDMAALDAQEALRNSRPARGLAAERAVQVALRNSRPDRNSGAGRESRRQDGSPTDIARAA